MSSTNRSPVRRELDQYDTPAWCTRLILPHVLPITTIGVLDPCAGNGAILDVVASDFPMLSRFGFEIDSNRAFDARVKGRHIIYQADATKEWSCWAFEPSLVVVTNPPFSNAEEVIRACLTQAVHVVALLRLSFLASKKRASLWRDSTADVYVLPKRPSFTGRRTDSCDYAWFAWGPGRGGRWQRLEVT